MQLALLGAGMIGGSLALALKDGAEALHITAYDPTRAHAEYLLAKGAVDTVAASAAEAVREADIVVIAAPLGAYRALASEIAPALRADSVVTDVGSVKGAVLELAGLLPARLVAAHPIAGGEVGGPEAARADLFKGRLCILTPDDKTDTKAREIVQTLWHATGADVIEMPAEVHDQIYAYVSHLPHYIAYVTAAYFRVIGVAAEETTRSFLRIARSSPVMWRDIALANREHFLPVLGTYIALLGHFATELRAGEKTTAEDAAQVAKAYVPRILSASLISCMSLYEQQSGIKLRPFGAGGLRDILAPASQAPEGDMEAISAVSHALADHLEALIVQFKALERMVGAADGEALLSALQKMEASAQELAKLRN